MAGRPAAAGAQLPATIVVADGARERREAIRQLAELRRRLAAAEERSPCPGRDEAGRRRVDAASDRFDAAERALDVAREERAQARRDRYAARQAYEAGRADRLARRVRELVERLDRMPLPVRGKPCVRHRRGGGGGPMPPDVDPPLDRSLVRPGGEAQLSHVLVVGRPGLPLAVAQRQPSAFGQQVGPPARGLGQRLRGPGDPPIAETISVADRLRPWGRRGLPARATASAEPRP